MNLKEKHILQFGKPDLEVWSPGRINLIGEHTDYNGGWVLPAAIDRGFTMYFSFGADYDSFELYSRNLENHKTFTGDSKPLPPENWAKYLQALIWVVEENEDIVVPYFKVSMESSIPAGGGLSSSAAMNAGFLTAIKHRLRLDWTGARMAELAQWTEHRIGAHVGIMDPYAVIHGENNAFVFLDCQKNTHRVVKADFQDYALILVDTGVTHDHAASGYNDRRSTCEKVIEMANIFKSAATLRDLEPDDLRRIHKEHPEISVREAEFVFEENDRVREAVQSLESGNFEKLGQLMYESHEGLQHKYRVSCPELDYLVNIARESDLVKGARMMGGGFGGSTINLVHKDNIDPWIHLASQEYQSKYGITPSILKAKPAGGSRVIE